MMEAKRVRRGARIAAVAALCGVAGSGCAESVPGTGPDPNGPEGTALVSDPIPFGAAPARSAVPVAGLAGLADFSFTAFLPGEYPGGASVEIRNQRTGERISAPMLEGGLDPVGVPAEVGDVLEITVLSAQAMLARSYHTVPRRKAPIVVRTQPPAGKTKVPLNAAVVVVFSEPVDGGSVTPESFELLRRGERVGGTLRIFDGGLRAEFIPDEELRRSTEYKIRLTGAVNDLSGDPLEAPYEASFTTDSPPLTGRIVFEGRQTGIGEIYFMNPDGTGVVQVTDRLDGGWSVSPSVSPDGTTIAFSWLSGPESSDWEIYSILVDGTGARNLTAHPGFDGWRPVWSPDGQRIAFFSARDGSDEIYTMRADGSDLRRLTDDPADDANPAWSPDGTRIAFTSDRAGSYDIWVMGTDGNDPVPLTADPAEDDWPAWSPDGTRIAFTSDRSGERAIWVMNPDGSSPALLTAGGSTTASWSPDGSHIAFDRGGSVYLMNADGTDAERVRSGMFPSWGP